MTPEAQILRLHLGQGTRQIPLAMNRTLRCLYCPTHSPGCKKRVLRLPDERAGWALSYPTHATKKRRMDRARELSAGSWRPPRGTPRPTMPVAPKMITFIRLFRFSGQTSRPEWSRSSRKDTRKAIPWRRSPAQNTYSCGDWAVPAALPRLEGCGAPQKRGIQRSEPQSGCSLRTLGQYCAAIAPVAYNNRDHFPGSITIIRICGKRSSYDAGAGETFVQIVSSLQT